MYGRKKKDKPVKKMKGEECSAIGVCGETQHKVPKAVKENKKVKPKEVFGSNYKDKKKSKG